MTPEQDAALAVARTLAELGVPVFVARPAIENGQWNPAGGHGGCGYWLPKGWETTTANPRYVDAWQPGKALCAVMGRTLDLVDLDPRNGGDPTSLNGTMPTVYAVAATPSQGWHGFVKTMGVRSRDAVLPGIDIKAGVDGEGHGFAFIAPTVKLSKVTGEIGQYRWERPPRPDVGEKLADDRSGEKLAEIIKLAHGAKRRPPNTDEDAGEAREWLTSETIPRGSRYPWLRSYAGWLREKNVRLVEARVLMRARWQACAQPSDYPMPWTDANDLLEDIYARYAAGGTVIDEGWATPVPLDQPYPPPLPLDACGPVLGPLAAEVAQSLQVPADLVVNMALSVITTAAQGRWTVRIGPDWTEIVSISSTSVANSGERKSPILRIVCTKLREVEREIQDTARPNVRWRAEQIKLAEARIEETRKLARKDPNREADLKAELDALEHLPPATLPRLTADDATPEALNELLAAQHGTIGVLSAEPGFFATLAGRYANKIPNLDGVLKATSGEPILVDRKGREPIIIDSPCLTVSVCIQPGLLNELGKTPELRHAGFLARFLYVAPAPMVGSRKVSIVSTNPGKSNTDLFSLSIQALAFRAYSTKQYTQSSELSLSSESSELLHAFRARLEPRLHPHTGDLATIADWGSKLPGATARIAAALTLLEDDEATTVESWTMANAIRLAEAYIPHAAAVLDTIRGHGDDLAKARDVLRIILKKGWSTFSLRDLHQSLRNTGWVRDARGRGPEVIAEELEALTDYGHVRPMPEPPQSGAGRKPSPRYEVNPAHLEDVA